MSDPFDGYIEDLFNVQLEKINSKAYATLIEMLIRDPPTHAQRIGVPLNDAIAASGSINATSGAQRKELLKRLTSLENEDLFPQLKAERESLEVQKAAVVALFRNTPISSRVKRLKYAWPGRWTGHPTRSTWNQSTPDYRCHRHRRQCFGDLQRER